jgi:hypothetical protein
MIRCTPGAIVSKMSPSKPVVRRRSRIRRV